MLAAVSSSNAFGRALLHCTVPDCFRLSVYAYRSVRGYYSFFPFLNSSRSLSCRVCYVGSRVYLCGRVLLLLQEDWRSPSSQDAAESRTRRKGSEDSARCGAGFNGRISCNLSCELLCCAHFVLFCWVLVDGDPPPALIYAATTSMCIYSSTTCSCYFSAVDGEQQ